MSFNIITFPHLALLRLLWMDSSINRCSAAVEMHLNRKNGIGCSSNWLNCLNVLVLLYCVQYN